MDASLKILQIIRAVMLASIVFYAALPEWLKPMPVEPPDKLMLPIFTVLAITNVAAMFLVRRLMIAKAAEVLRQRPADILALNKWKTGYIATFACAEAVGLYGLVLRFLGFKLPEALPFYVASALLLVFLGPRRVSDEVG